MAISFTTRLFTIGSWTILRLPKEASAQLPSRGQTMVEGTVNGAPFKTPLEPDGDWSHWFQPEPSLLAAAHAAAGDTVQVTIEPTKDWVEPPVPADLKKAIAADPAVAALWQQITPMARWEWVRWTRSTNSAETRKRRVTVACSKLRAGKRRPCCWNRNLCTEPGVSKGGLLLNADDIAA
jgi:hypothetical protein